MTVALGKFPFEKAAEGGYWALLQALKDSEAPMLNDVAGEDLFSDDFQDFVSKCLIKDPMKRPSAEMLMKHPFVSGVDVKSEPGIGDDDDGEMEGGGSDTARSEMEDIVGVVVEYYRQLWYDQSERDVSLTVPNFNKATLRNLGRQIGLDLGLIQRKMRGVLKQLKQELEHGYSAGEDGKEGDSFYSRNNINSGRSLASERSERKS